MSLDEAIEEFLDEEEDEDIEDFLPVCLCEEEPGFCPRHDFNAGDDL